MQQNIQSDKKYFLNGRFFLLFYNYKKQTWEVDLITSS